MENYKDSDIASVKSTQGASSDLWNELANIKAVMNKTWNYQQESQQKKDKCGGSQKKGEGSKTTKQTSGEKGPCFGLWRNWTLCEGLPKPA